MHHVGWTADGRKFDSSYDRGRPSQFKPTMVIAGFAEGLERMRVGDRVLLWIPEALAYEGRAGAPQGPLIFEVSLLSIDEPPAMDPGALLPGPDAQTSATGLAWQCSVRGDAFAPRPTASSRVTVHYDGFDATGKLFDSSRQRGRPATFRLPALIDGWREGLLQMRQGDTCRLWIPGALAYDGKPGRPQGMLIFDVELLEVLP